MTAYQNLHTLLSVRKIQEYLNTLLPAHSGSSPSLKVDGILGDKTWKALMLYVAYQDFDGNKSFRNWPRNRKYVAAQQLILEALEFDAGEIDGYVGPVTLAAVEKWQNSLLAPSKVVQSSYATWPYERECPKFYGKIGEGHVTLTLPYSFRLTWNTSTVLKKISVHKKCSESLERVLTNVREVYGMNDIADLGLNLFSGCYNPRKKRGGTSWSMHAYACALDFYDSRNQYRWGADQAVFAQSVYEPWWKAWEDEGWVSLGRQRNFDWMHVQAALI